MKRKLASITDMQHVVRHVKHPDLKLWHRLLLLELVGDMNAGTGTGARPTLAVLASAMDRSQETIRIWFKQLQSMGLIRLVHKAKGPGNANVYDYCLENDAYPDEYPGYKVSGPRVSLDHSTKSDPSQDRERSKLGSVEVQAKTPRDPSDSLDPSLPPPEPPPPPPIQGPMAEGEVLSKPSTIEIPDGWFTSTPSMEAMGTPNKEMKSKLRALANAWGKYGYRVLRLYIAHWQNRPEGMKGLNHPWTKFECSLADLKNFAARNPELQRDIDPTYKAREAEREKQNTRIFMLNHQLSWSTKFREAATPEQKERLRAAQTNSDIVELERLCEEEKLIVWEDPRDIEKREAETGIDELFTKDVDPNSIFEEPPTPSQVTVEVDPDDPFNFKEDQ